MKFNLRTILFLFVIFFALPNAAHAAYPFGDELIRYTFENGSTTAVTNLGTGGAAYDTTFSGNAALIATTSLAGNYAAIFDDNGDFINTRFGSSTNPTTQPFTISMWAIASSSCATVDKHVFGVSGTPAANRFYLRCGSAGPNKFVIRVQGQAAVISSTTVSYGQRYNVTMVASSTRALFYVNGQLTASSTYTSFTLPGPLYIGNIWENSSTPANQGFGGAIDEVSIWNRALNPSEVTEVANYLSTSSAPTALAGTGYDSKVMLTWTAPSVGGAPAVTDYQIEYRQTGAPTYTVFNDGVSAIASTTVTGLTIGQAYDFRVASVNSNGTSTASSSITVIPVRRMEWVSPTPSQSSTINTSSITVYASSSPSSFTGTTTQVIRLETAAGSLVGQVSTTTRYGDGDLTHYVNQVSGRDLSLTANSSGAAYVPTTNTIFIPHNVGAGSNSTIDEVDVEGNLIRTITCTACGDNEGIVLISSVASTTAGGYDHTFMLSTENNLASSTIFKMKIHSATGSTANYTDFYNLGIAHDSNLGLEGIAYNAEKDLFYVATEKVSAVSTPGRLYEVKLNGSSRNLQATQICSSLDFSAIATDFSDLFYRDNILYVLSHENDRLIPVNITSTSSCSFVDSDGDSNVTNDTGDYLNTVPVGVTTQPEGVTFDATSDYLYFIGEADFYARYRSTAFTTRASFTGLSNGSYVLKSYFVDVNGVMSSSTDRAFTVNVDSTAPSISNILTPTISTTTATVTWDTDETSTSQIIYGTTISYGATTTLDATAVTNHSVALTGLTQNTLYHYKVISVDAAGNGATSTDQTFTTAATDASAPSSTITSPSSGDSVAGTITINASATDNIGVLGVKFYYNTTLIGSEDTTSPYSISLDTTTLSDGSYNLRAVARDAVGNIATSSTVAITVDNTAPTQSSITAGTPGATTATIGWTTDEPAVSQVEYGLTSSYTASTTLTASYITNPSVALSGLAEATTYHYRVVSIDALGNRRNSTDQTFTTVDGSAPVISNIQSTSISTTTATITWDTNELSTRQVEYGITSAYTASTSLSVASSTSHSVALTGLTPDTIYHFRAVAYDQSGNRTNSSDTTFTTQTLFSIGSPSATVDSATAATLTWTTPQAGSSYVSYGLSSGSYAVTTSEVDTSPRVTNHSVVLSGLLPCTTYHYKVFSKDASLAIASSSNGSFVTTGGCTATAGTATTTESVVTVAGGATVTLAGSSGNVTLVVPTGFTGTSSSATFQAKDLNASTFFAGVANPTGQSLVGSRVFNLKAYSDISTVLSTFSSPIRVTLSYTAQDVVGKDESTLKIYRYDGSSWYALTNCVVDTGARTVTCDTSAFSDFAIFATSNAVSGISSSNSSGPVSAGGFSPNETPVAILARLNGGTSSTPGSNTSTGAGSVTVKNVKGMKAPLKNLKLGMNDSDVKLLQQILNNLGFTVAGKGAGSLGKETTLFGPATKAAVIKWQKAYGVSPQSGYFGPLSRETMQKIVK